MCGIAGLIDTAAQHTEVMLRDTAERMAEALQHRGPDDRGVWVDARAGVALGHRRLSVVDLSPGGRQPMISSSGRYVMVYNGEVYNHRQLRQELAGQQLAFRGQSDTEVLLEAIERWGLLPSLQRANGMFALALWDNHRQQLTLARDRLGIKPLYCGWSDRRFVFASELKALRAIPEFRNEVDRDALTLLLQHNYVPAPLSIYRGIHKLAAGSWLTISGRSVPGSFEPESYWSLRQAAQVGTDEPFAGSDREAVDQLQRLLSDAVRLRMQADVPWGAFLSGGIDSSTVVALMQAQADRPVKTFCIGFLEKTYNEAEYSRAVAKHLRTEHTTVEVTPAQAREVIPQLPTLYDEPFADSSQIPTYLVSQLARRDVTVSLSGDGGDELFGGYERYALLQRIWQRIGWPHRSIRLAGSRALRIVPPVGRIGRKVGTLADFLSARDARHLYTQFHTHWKRPGQVVIGGSLPQTPFYDYRQWVDRGNLLEAMMYVDTITYLPDDILTKVDRASMGVSLEARVPLLDHRVVEFAWRLPVHFKVRAGQSKWILRQLLQRYVPPALVERPKVGFGVPIDVWLRGPLRDWAESLLAEQRLREEGFFHVQPIRRKWAEHLSGRENWHYYLWDVLMFQAWLESQ